MADAASRGNPGGLPGGPAGRKEKPRRGPMGSGAGWWGIPAMTDFRAKGTIMGPAGLTAVFGMGTGGAPPVWSPGKRPAGGLGHAGRGSGPVVRHTAWGAVVAGIISAVDPSGGGSLRDGRDLPPEPAAAAAGRGGQVARLLGLVRCGGRPPCTPSPSTWSSSRSLRSPEAAGNLVSERASRLDAFSAYPIPTWLPGDAPSGTAGTPAVGPPQSSRTRGDPPQVSYTHGR